MSKLFFYKSIFYQILGISEIIRFNIINKIYILLTNKKVIKKNEMV
jgi:hypothetical protein